MNTYQDRNLVFFFEQAREFEYIYNEIFRESIYSSDIVEPKLIVDIGAHIGLASMYFHLQFPNAHILAYEPNPYLLPILKQNIETNNIKNINVIPTAIANKNGFRDFYIDSEDEWYSNSGFLEHGWDNSLNLSKIQVETINFRDILEQKPNIVKIDVEGTEMSLIKHNLELLTNVDLFLIEFHSGPNQSLTKFLNYFKNRGFRVSIIEDSINQNLILVRARRG